jgi:hypothetical protein
MNGEMSCEQVSELTPELAIGIADGEERDAALRHAATCPDCRRLLSELSVVVDELLLLAPSREPPAGFASRTVARIAPPPAPAHRRRPSRPPVRRVRADRRWLPRLATAASVVVALAVGAGVVYQGTSADRQLADSYRAVLAQGHGSFFAAASLRSPAGAVGTVFGYQGRPSWLWATVHLPQSGTQTFDVQLLTRDGKTLPLGSAIFGGRHESWGAQIPVALTMVTQLRFVAVAGHSTIVAHLDTRGPWGPG